MSWLTFGLLVQFLISNLQNPELCVTNQSLDTISVLQAMRHVLFILILCIIQRGSTELWEKLFKKPNRWRLKTGLKNSQSNVLERMAPQKKKKALMDTPEALNIRTWKKKCVHQHQLQRRSLPKRARGLYYIKCQETSKEVNFLEGSLLPPITKKSQLKDKLPTKQNCIIIYCVQQTALASLLLVESLSGNTTETVRTFTNFPVTQIELIWMLQPALPTNENHKWGLEIVTEEKAIIHD